jgi:hypothetical protein
VRWNEPGSCFWPRMACPVRRSGGWSEPRAVLWRNRYAERVVMLGCSLRCLTSSRMSGVSRWWSTLTAKLTANQVNSCRSLATSADEHDPSSCINGRQRTALDGRGRVTKEYGSSWIFELRLTWANALRPSPEFSFLLGRSSPVTPRLGPHLARTR